MASMMARPMLDVPTSPRPWIPASVSIRTKRETRPLSSRTGTFFYFGYLHWIFLFLLRRRKGLSPVVMLKMVLPCSHVLRVDGFFALVRCRSERSEESDHLAVGCHLGFFTPLRFVQNDMFGGCAPFRMTCLGDALRSE